MNHKVSVWLELCREDAKAAGAMYQAELYVHMGFMCQQAVEKAIKALCEQKNSEVWPTHNLTKLMRQTGCFSLLNDRQAALLTRLQPLYIEARYPVYKTRIKELLTKEYSQSLLKDVEDLVQWIIELLTKQDTTPAKSENG